MFISPKQAQWATGKQVRDMDQKLVLHRDNPEKEPLTGHIKVTREDWINVARDILVNHGVGEVKILAIGERLGVSRSSFYGYFESRKDLLESLLADWRNRNTATILAHCEKPAPTINTAVCNFFRCFFDPDLFDRGLDFAVREWSRRETGIRKLIDEADRQRLAAVAKMFERYGYEPLEADVRARILYYMQLGYHALEVKEPLDERIKRLPGYLEGFTGRPANLEEFSSFLEFAKSVSIKVHVGE